MVTLELLFKGGAFMSPQVDMEKKELEQLFLDAYDGGTKIVHINEVFVNIDEIQFIKVVEIPAQIIAQKWSIDEEVATPEYPTEIPLGDLK